MDSTTPHPIKPNRHHRGHIIPLIRNALIIVLVAGIAAYFITSQHSIVSLSASNYTARLSSGQSLYFTTGNGKSTYALYLENTSTQSAGFYLSMVPVLTNPITVFSLQPKSELNISANLTGNADLRITLDSSNAKNSTITLIGIPSQFAVKQSPGIVSRQPAPLYSYSNSTQPNLQANQSLPATQSNTTAKTTPTPPPSNTVSNTTTTKPSVQSPLDNVSSLLNTTYVGSLMKKYAALYSKDTACTPSTYNTTFMAYRTQFGAGGQNPVGAFDFANLSKATPTGVNVTASYLGKNNYLISYLLKVPSAQSPATALTLNLNSSSGVITNLKFQGLYADLNYSSLDNAYTFQSSISGSCGALIP